MRLDKTKEYSEQCTNVSFLFCNFGNIFLGILILNTKYICN